MTSSINEQAAALASAKRTGVIVVGSITADVTTFSPRLPRRGETIFGDDVTLVLGGKGANQAVAASRAGAGVELVGCVGTDAFQALVLDGLSADGVVTEHLRIVEGATGVAHIRVDDTGENDIVIVPKANSSLSIEQVTAALGDIGPTAAVLLTQLEVPAPVVLHAIRLARSAGLITVLDPAPAPVIPLSDEVWASVDIVTPNETEAATITGTAVTDAASATRAGQWFLDRGTRAALITLASAGAVLVTADGSSVFAALTVTAIDTTAAGDAFAGYLGAGLARGDSLDVALRSAMAAGALAVTRRGASPSLPFRAEVDDLLQTTTQTNTTPSIKTEAIA
ncbi:ribokinase [Alpinimonas psychrophila]|uniref:Ribokinase n=1 Tax=Alpinimonas psychrophila TaxID=748908 RepID=A0A7W3JUW1_9MICO|nr:ribokinase [Alpinimonas psychrophila]MBA8829679.1 ribokinase [Alpinimonas psychrophila]